MYLRFLKITAINMQLIFVIIIALVLYLLYQMIIVKSNNNTADEFLLLNKKTKVNKENNKAVKILPNKETYNRIDHKKFVINPGTCFDITLLNATTEDVKILKDILNRRNKYDEFAIHDLIAGNNIKIKEVHEYISKYLPVYQNSIDSQIENCNEWDDAFEKRRNELLIDFKIKASKSLSVQPQCYLVKLFEVGLIDDYSINELVKIYGVKALKFYLEELTSNKPRRIEKGAYKREYYELLVKKGLAIDGTKFEYEEFLYMLKLKEFEMMCNKKFTRKIKAVEYVMNNDIDDETIGQYISYNEVYKIIDLPEKFHNIDVEQAIKEINFLEEVVYLLHSTYSASYNFVYTALNNVSKGVEKEFYFTSGNCPCCLKIENKFFEGKNLPDTPKHIGDQSRLFFC